MLKQKLQQKLLQKLSPLQIQTIKLLELPIMQLEQRIKKEMEENPVLEDDTEYAENADEYNEPDAGDEFSPDDYLDEDDNTPSYKYNAGNSAKNGEYKEYSTLTSSVSLQQTLEEQLAFRYLNDRQHTLGLFLIGSIDNDGYLRRDLEAVVDDIAFKLNIETTESELEDILKIIQTFDPPGSGSRDLRECLTIQLACKSERTENTKIASEIVEKYFDEFTKKHYDKIASRLELNDNALKNAVNEITKLNPKPGAYFENVYSEQARQIIPDFILEIKNGEPEPSLNSFNAPELKINKEYSQIMENYAWKQNSATRKEKDAAVFVKQKMDSAKWFIDALKQRQNTLINTMKAIIRFQSAYFKTGEESSLRPMILKDIADMTGLDVSTVSRVVNSKYIQTDWGIFALRYFFSEGIVADSGEEVSTREVKRIIVECIENENKRNPYTDEELTDILKEKGYPIARRTVAKYREKMNIPVGRLRKEL